MDAATETSPIAPRAAREIERGLWILLAFAVAAMLVRGLVAMPRSVPSESMLPGLLPGDYVLVARWRYGWSHTSFPFGWPRLRGRLLAQAPERGDVVVFRAPPDGRTDYIKRLVGLPGDTIALRGGQLILNGAPVPRVRGADIGRPNAPNAIALFGCCNPLYTETLPGGRRYDVIVHDAMPQETMGPFRVPPGHYFMLGDNRDVSLDSRFPARPGGGIGMVPADEVEGPAVRVLLSVDGTARWAAPWRWLAALRIDRTGKPIA